MDAAHEATLPALYAALDDAMARALAAEARYAALVAALPRCGVTGCGQPATRTDAHLDRCDAHPEPWHFDDLPWADAVRGGT